MSTYLFVHARARDLLECLKEIGCPSIPMSVKLEDKGGLRRFSVRFPGVSVSGHLLVWTSAFGEHGRIDGEVLCQSKNLGGFALSAKDVEYAMACASWKRNGLPCKTLAEF